jgi:hypothetical protein
MPVSNDDLSAASDPRPPPREASSVTLCTRLFGDPRRRLAPLRSDQLDFFRKEGRDECPGSLFARTRPENALLALLTPFMRAAPVAIH